MLDAAGVSGLEVVSLDDVPAFDEAPETGATFEENALAKARDAFAATGLPAVADDSGLEVAALNGMPGVLSARWAGRHGEDVANYELLLAQLRDVPDERRAAAFVSACALVYGSGPDDHAVVRGQWPGVIARAPRGEGGFGYDPVFVRRANPAVRPSSVPLRRTRSPSWPGADVAVAGLARAGGLTSPFSNIASAANVP